MKDAFGKYIDFKLLKNNDKELKSLKLYEVVNFDKRFKGVPKEKQEKILNFKHVSSDKLKSYNIEEKGIVRLISTGNFDFYTNIDINSKEVNFGEIISLPSGGRANLKYHNGYFIDSLNILFSSKDTVKYNLKYIYYFLKANIKEIEDNFRGSSIQHPDMTKIIEMSILIPSLEKQKEIVNILDKFTELETELETELNLRNLQYDYYLNSLLDFSNNEMLLKNIMNLNSKEKLDTNVKKINLTDICDFSRGKIYSKEYIKDNPGVFPVYSSKTLDSGILGTMKTYDYDGEYVTWTTDGQYAGTVFYRSGKFSVTDRSGIFEIKEPDKINTRFLYFLLKITLPKYVNRSVDNYKLTPTQVKAVKLSIPSIEIQNKIANILDKLETYTKDIKTGLPLEIKQRKEQFDYYHKMLLTFDDNLERERES